MTEVDNVPLLDLTRSDPELLDAMRAAFDRVLVSGRYIMGPEIDGLEAECAEAIGVKHAIGVSSGTDALICALMSRCIGPGDEVICPTYTFFATAGSIWRVGAKPVFVDIDPVTYNLDPAAIEAKVNHKTRAIMPVHLFGQCAEMKPILEIAAKHGLDVIEDAAQAISAKYDDGRQAGSMGQFGCFSFFPSKNLGCLGDGGLVTSNDDDAAEIARRMRVHGGKPKYHHHLVGGNFRLDPLQATMLRLKLPRLAAATDARRRNAAHYEKRLREAGVAASETVPTHAGEVGLPVAVRDHIYNQFTLRSTERDALRAWLGERRIGTEIYYPVPMHQQECFKTLEYKAGDFPHSECAAVQTLALPIFPELTEAELDYVADAIIAFCKERAGALS